MTYPGDFPLLALALLVAVAGWFTIMARTHFSAQSPRTPVLFVLEALSLALVVATVVIVLWQDAIPLVRAVAAILLGGAAALLFRAALNATRQRDFGVVFGGTVPRTVVSDGPYRFVRHPLYAAYTVNWAGCAVLAGSWPVAALAAAIAVFYWCAAKAEERDLMRSSLGPAYRAYRRETGLFLPRMVRSNIDETGPHPPHEGA